MKYFSLSFLLVLLLSFSSCSNNDPKYVAEKFLTSVARADLDEAKKYCDSTTVELLDQADYLNMVPDSVKAEGRKLKVNIVDVKTNGDKAVVTYTTSKLAENQLITLVKQNGKWLVQLDKAQQYEEDDQPIMTEALDNIPDSTTLAKPSDSTIADTATKPAP
ncbi:hypothetical protein [Rurimicrobium arvi]